jgi:hypothetical protein
MIPGKNQKVDRPQVIQMPKGPGQDPCANPAYAAQHPLVCGGSMAPKMPQMQIPAAPKAAPAAMPAPQQPQQDPMSTPGGMMQMYMGGSGAKKGFQAGVDKGWWSNPFADPARQSTFNYTPGMQAEMAASGDIPFNPSNPSGVVDWTGAGKGMGTTAPSAAGTPMNPVMMKGGVPVETAGVTKAGTFMPPMGGEVAGFGQTTMMPGAGGTMVPVENLMTQAGTEGLLGGAATDTAATAAADAAAAEALAAQQAAALQAAAAESAAATAGGAAAAEGAAASATGFAAAAPWLIPVLAGAYMFGLLD